MDSYGNIATGGYVSGTNPAAYSSPFVEYYSATGGVQWSQTLSNAAYNLIEAVKFTTDFSQIAVVFDKPTASTALLIAYLKASNGGLLKQYQESSTQASGDSLIYPNSLVHQTDDSLYVAMMLYSKWTFFKIDVAGSSSSSVTSSFFYTQKSTVQASDGHCSRALAVVRDSKSFYITGLYKDSSDSGKCNSAGLIRVTDHSSSPSLKWAWSIRYDNTDGIFFYLGYVERQYTSSGDSYILACGYKDTSQTASESSAMLAAFARYTIDSSNDLQSSDTRIYYYSSSNSANANSKCITFTQQGYALVLNTATGSSVDMLAHIAKISMSSPTNAFIYQLTPFQYTDNFIRHALFTQSGTHLAFAGELLKSSGQSLAYPFAFLMYMEIGTGAVADTCLTFSTIAYNGVNQRALQLQSISELYYQEDSDMSGWFDSTSIAFDQLSLLTAQALTISTTVSDNRIVCANSGRVPYIELDPISAVTWSTSSSSDSEKEITYKVYQDNTKATQCNMSVTFSMTGTTESTITIKQNYIKWTSSTPVASYSLTITGTLSNLIPSAPVIFSLTITAGSSCSSTTLTAPTPLFTTTIQQYNLYPQTTDTYTLNAFTSSVSGCSISYSLKFSDGSSTSGSPFSLSGMTFQVGPTTDNSYVKTNYLKIVASASSGSVQQASPPFQVIIGRSECLSAMISLDTAANDQVFTLSSTLTTPQMISLPTYASTQSTSLCGEWNYALTTITDSSGTTVTSFGGSTNIFSWDSAFTQLTAFLAITPTSLYLSPYTITAKAYQGPYSSQSTVSKQFKVSFTQQCLVTALEPNPLDIASIGSTEMVAKDYVIGSGSLSVKVNPFLQTADCNSPLTYKMSVSGGGLFPTFIKGAFDGLAGGTITISSSSRIDALNPLIILKITATPSTSQPLVAVAPIATLTIPINIKVQNQGPPTFKSEPKPLTVTVGQSLLWSLPAYSDPDSPLDNVLSDQSFGSAASFISGTFPSYTIKPTSNTDHIGQFTLTLTLKDDNPNQQSTTYSILLTVLASGQNSTSNTSDVLAALPPVKLSIFSSSAIKQRANRKSGSSKNKIELKATIRSINQNGLAVIGFNVPVLEIANLTAVDERVIQISVAPGVDSNPSMLKIVSWKATSMTSMSLSVKMTFENPLYISLYQNPEFLKIKVVNNEFFINEETFLPIKNETVITKKLPKQLPMTSATAALQSAGGPTSSTMNSVMFGNLALNLVMAASLQYLWGMINVMQMIVNMPLLSVQFPPNAVLFYNFIKDISNFDVIPTESIKAAIFSVSDNDGETGDQFKQMGYDSTSIVENLGSMLLYIVGFILLVAFVLLIRFLRKKYKTIDRIYTYLSNMIFFNMILRTIMEGYIQYSLTSMMNVANLEWKTSTDRFSSVFAIMVFSVVVIFPFFVWRLVWTRTQEQLDQPLAKTRYGSVYFELRLDSQYALLYNVLYMSRRLLFAIIVVVFPGQTFLQIQLMVFHCILLIIYNVLVKPFELPLLNQLEIFNEGCIIAAAYHLFIFTSYVDDPEMQYKWGFSIIGVTTFNIVVNMCVMIKATYHQVHLLIKKLRYKYRVWSHNRAKKSQKKEAEQPTLHIEARDSKDFDSISGQHQQRLEEIDPEERIDIAQTRRRNRNRKLILDMLGITPAQPKAKIHTLAAQEKLKAMAPIQIERPSMWAKTKERRFSINVSDVDGKSAAEQTPQRELSHLEFTQGSQFDYGGAYNLEETGGIPFLNGPRLLSPRVNRFPGIDFEATQDQEGMLQDKPGSFKLQRERRHSRIPSQFKPLQDVNALDGDELFPVQTRRRPSIL